MILLLDHSMLLNYRRSTYEDCPLLLEQTKAIK
jgi:hypothetical protein